MTLKIERMAVFLLSHLDMSLLHPQHVCLESDKLLSLLDSDHSLCMNYEVQRTFLRELPGEVPTCYPVNPTRGCTRWNCL